MSKIITPKDPEIADVLQELIARSDAIEEAQALGEASFRKWLYEQMRQIASALGLVIQGLYEFVMDIGHGFATGFQEGRDRARANSIRRKEKR